MQPLVSICIPTYNRAACLEKTIESIICQPEFVSGEVEIVVSDNASEDITAEVCGKYKEFTNFYYHRNPENVRDKNFPIVLSKAHGKLRKLNNDTLVLGKGSLGKLCNLVKQYDETRPFILLRNEKNESKELNFHDFVLEVGYWITWIAGFTIWDNECNQIETDTDGCELLLWQVRKAYELASKKNSTVVYYDLLGTSITPPKKDISYGLYKIFYCNYMALLQPHYDAGKLSSQDMEYLEKELLFKFFGDWIIRYELNNTDMQYSKEEDLKAAVWKQYENMPYWNEFKTLYKRKKIKEKIKLIVKRILGKA